LARVSIAFSTLPPSNQKDAPRPLFTLPFCSSHPTPAKVFVACRSLTTSRLLVHLSSSLPPPLYSAESRSSHRPFAQLSPLFRRRAPPSFHPQQACGIN
jgi:hypothetical protein